jgi:hypothetical protein
LKFSRSCKWPKGENVDGCHVTEKAKIDYISRSCDFPKREIFDGLHKHLKNAFEPVFSKKEFPFWEIFDGLPKKEILMAYVSNFLWFWH